MNPNPRSERLSRKDQGIALALLLAALLPYAGTLDHDFVNLDDGTYVVNNPNVNRGLTRDGLLWAWTTDHASNWHPLTWISHMLDCEIFGLDPGGHHAVSVLLHALNAALLFLVLRLASGQRWTAGLVAALFALHPLRVESVAWIAERKDVLSGLFFILALLAYVRYVRRSTIGRYAAVLFATAAGLAAKPMLVTLPFVLLLLDVWPLGRWPAGSGEGDGPPASSPTRIRLIAEKLPLLVLAVGSSAATIWAQSSGRAMGPIASLPVTERLANVAFAYVAYLWKTLWPAKLAFFYPHASLVANDQASGRVALAVGAALVLAAATLLVLRATASRRYLSVGWFWYLGMLVPVIGLIQVGSQAMADRYTYLPLIGIYIMLAWSVRDVLMSRARLRAGVAIVMTLLLAALVVQSWRQARYWSDTRTLAEHALDVTRDNFVAHFLLANELQQMGDLKGALLHFRSAVEIVPDYARAHQGLGNVLLALGDTEGAIASYEEALRIRPDYEVVHYNLGLIRARRGEIDAAVAHYEEAIRIRPDYAAAHNNLGSLLHQRGDLEGAVSNYEAAIRADPDHARARFNLGLTLEMQGDFARAEVYYRDSLRIEESASAYEGLARVLDKLGRPAEAAGVRRSGRNLRRESSER